MIQAWKLGYESLKYCRKVSRYTMVVSCQKLIFLANFDVDAAVRAQNTTTNETNNNNKRQKMDCNSFLENSAVTACKYPMCPQTSNSRPLSSHFHHHPNHLRMDPRESHTSLHAKHANNGHFHCVSDRHCPSFSLFCWPSLAVGGANVLVLLLLVVMVCCTTCLSKSQNHSQNTPTSGLPLRIVSLIENPLTFATNTRHPYAFCNFPLSLSCSLIELDTQILLKLYCLMAFKHSGMWRQWWGALPGVELVTWKTRNHTVLLQ